jgi:hypothetical protein
VARESDQYEMVVCLPTVHMMPLSVCLCVLVRTRTTHSEQTQLSNLENDEVSTHCYQLSIPRSSDNSTERRSPRAKSDCESLVAMCWYFIAISLFDYIPLQRITTSLPRH